MKKAWNIVLVIVFIAVLIGATAVGVGYLTGADVQQVYLTLENSTPALFVQRLISYWELGSGLARQLIAGLAA